MRHLSDILAKAGLVVDGVVTLNNVANATIDTDKFLVIDSGVVKYRTGTQMLSDIGAAAAAAGLPPGGTAGQILAKIDATNYNAEWIDNYTSNVRHLVKLASAMTVGTPVYVSGSTGQSGTNMIVSPASNTSEATSSKTLGLLVTGGATNDIVFVVTEGLLGGLNTNSAVAGDPVWLGPNGTLLYGLINKPVAPVHTVFIGVVTRVQQNNGEIFVKVQNGYELEELHNVLITDVGDKHFLYRDGPTNLWKNASISTILGYTPANSTSISGTVNRVAKFTSASAVGDSQIFDNGTSVGVGTSSPTAKLDVSIGNINLSNAYYLSSRNAANTANLSMIGRNTGDRIVIDPDGYGTNIGGGGSVLINLAGGQVAIGTSSPVSGSVLDIAGSTNVYPRIRSTGTGEAFMFFQNTNSGTTAADGLFVGINSGNDAFFYNAEATPARFFTSAIERMRITASGNVGIGTTSPASILNVRASSATFTIDDSGDGTSKISFRPSAASYAERAFISVNYTTAEMSIGAGVSAGAYFQTFYTNGTERLRIASNGNVGIGTTSPSNKLHVYGSGSVSRFESSTTNSALNIAHNGNGGLIGYSNQGSTGNLFYITTGTAVIGGGITMDNNGNVGIGTASPSYKTHIKATRNTSGLQIEMGDRNAVNDYTQIGFSFDPYPAITMAAIRTTFVSPFTEFATNLSFHTYGTSLSERMVISSTGVITVANLAGSGARLVVADASGNLSATTLSSSVTTGSGTTNYITKWTGASALGNSQIIDNGNIGIGDVPLDKFTITVDQNSTVTGRIRNTSTGSSAYSQWAVNASGNSWGLRMGSSAANSNALDIVSDALGTPAIRMRYFTNGRIGVNTTTDAGYQLDVNGSIRAIGLIRSQATVGNTNGYFQLEHPGSQTWKLGVFADNASTFSIGNDNGGVFASRYLNITNVGDIGIATTSPSYKLDINGTLRSVNGANFATTSGNVGIGTASPAYKFHVLTSDATIAAFRNSGAANGQILIGNTAGDLSIRTLSTGDSYIFSDTGKYLDFGSNASFRMRLTSDGELLVATTSDAGDYKLQVSGNIYNTGSAVLAAAGGEVLIGTTTDLGAYKLQVNGISFFGSNANKYVLLNNTSSNAAIQAYGDWVNHLRLTYPAVVDFDMQVTAAGELDVKRSSNVVTRINAAGKFLINTTTDVGDYKLQVNGSVYNTGQVTAGVINIQGTGAQLFVDGTTNLSPLSAIQTLSGANNSAFLSGNVTWNTTGSPNAIDISVTNTASGSNANFMQLGDGTNNFKVTKDAGIITANPTSGTARKWKLGSVVSSTVVLVTSQYVEVEINGTFYRLALVTPA